MILVFVYHSDEFDIYVFALMHWLSWKPLCEPNFFFYVLCVFALRITSGRMVKLAGPVVYSTDHSKAMVPVLVLLFVALWFILRGDLFYVLSCVILFLCFSVLSAMRLPRLRKRASLGVFRTFIRFALVCFCLFSLPLGVWEGLRFVIMALPGLFSYPCFY